MPAYQFKPGFRCGATAATVASEMDRIRARTQAEIVRPVELVEAARSPSSPIHDVFEWDDATAGELYRIDQARAVIRNIIIVAQSSDDAEPTRVQAFASVNVNGEGRGYVSTARIVADDVLRERMIADALSSLEGWQRRFAHLDGLAPLLAAIEVAAEEVRGTTSKTKNRTKGR